MNKNWTSLFLLPFIMLLLAACGGEAYQAPPADAAVNVAVSILPQQYFVQKIGGEHVSVLVMAGPGVNPLTYEPPKGQFDALKERDIYFLMGIPPEGTWLDGVQKAAPDIELVDISRGVPKIDADPHIWLSPQRVKTQAETIAQALMAADPAHKADYEANLAIFLAELDKLDEDIRQVIARNRVTGKTFIVSHPAWGYFAADYGLQMVAIPENATDAQLQELASLATSKGIDVIFYQRGFDEETPARLAEMIAGRVVPLEPLNPNWEANLRSVALMLAKTAR
ncbi:MAG TPA: cation ABC transporter substrate-binding protein [Anaerolineae bacterium]|nr:cation ABC transporter substrate-binding protein [Anaerolineae bacterium]